MQFAAISYIHTDMFHFTIEGFRCSSGQMSHKDTIQLKSKWLMMMMLLLLFQLLFQVGVRGPGQAEGSASWCFANQQTQKNPYQLLFLAPPLLSCLRLILCHTWCQHFFSVATIHQPFPLTVDNPHIIHNQPPSWTFTRPHLPTPTIVHDKARSQHQ